MNCFRILPLSLLAAAAVTVPSLSLMAQSPTAPRSVVTEQVNPRARVALPGNVRSAANAANDRGRVNDALALDHMMLQLQRAPEKEQELAAYVDDLHTAGSPNFHKWLTPAQLREQYGPTESDVAAVTTWLAENGFTVHGVAANGMTVDFSGSAQHVRNAFGTEIHHLNVNGVDHIANMQDPQVPAALAGVIKGVVSLHDFHPRIQHKEIAHGHADLQGAGLVAADRPEYSFSSGGGSYQAVVPGDLATIYNLNPLFAAGISGQGQTIVVIEDTNVYSTADWTTFRTKFGLSGYTQGNFIQVHPGSNCSNPGVNGDDGEAILDAEWASAAAPNATIELASCADTRTTFGGLIALQNIINSSNPPKIVSISYGECEAENGAAANAAYSSAYQAAVAAGISVFVSSGDEGAASCDANQTKATHGINVSGFASTPYNVAVGGTDFGDTATHTNSTYWNTTNTAAYASAKSYIPEIPWNDSCASTLLANYGGYSTTYGTSGFCNSANGTKYYLTTASGSGGPSACATGNAATFGVVSGSCAGYAKPSWQAVLGNPNDKVRDIPDVSLFAANGVWGHYFVYCYTDTRNGGASCAGAPSTWSGAGGTSFSAPIMAAIQSLVNQKTGSPQGNPNYVYYELAAKGVRLDRQQQLQLGPTATASRAPASSATSPRATWTSTAPAR